MTKSFNTQRINAIFQDADNSQAGFATRLFDEGIFNRADAIPHVIAFVSTKYKVKAKQGQRGLTFEKDTAPHAAMVRILRNCFESAPSTSKSNKTDAVKALLSRYTKLTPAEKRRFLASV
jgi:hypothetical protein